MAARTVARVALFPFEVAWAALYQLGRFVWHLFLASNPLTIALWMMLHSHPDEIPEEES